ncbi:MAG: type IV pilus modification protein PilV [Xanthomonadales bacterium]|nr:type IV pilus modification protein PilV [Xanthomonadales bacterium]
MNTLGHSLRQGGFSLIEVMVAVLVFSVGLLGIAGLLVIATSADHGAYQRTQVAYLAQNMADRMSANPVGVWGGAYNNGSYPVTGTPPSCSAGCTPAQLAAYDQAQWSAQLNTFLPNPRATIACVNAGAGYVPSAANLNMRPPYGGNCAMTITWSDRGFGDSTGRATQDQTFAWNFQP